MIAKARKKSRYDFEPSNRVQFVKLDRIRVSTENEQIYRSRTRKNKAFDRFCRSVAKKGIQAPLIISRDGFIISGHQRLATAIEVGLDEVPIIVLPLRRSDHTQNEWIALLREHNTGREKTLDERIRENIIDIDPDEAMRAVVDDQVSRANPKSKTVYVPEKFRTRARITRQTRAFADAIKGILEGALKDSLPVPERAIHYHLLPMHIRTSLGKKEFIYDNEKNSTKALSSMLTRLRLCGEVPWDSICDETRFVAKWATWRDAAEFVGEKSEKLYTGFARDLMQSQAAYYEIILEKLTIKGFIDKVAARYTIPTTTLRGNSSIDARYRLAERFKASGKKSLVLFVLADCDPAGDSICESTVHSLRDEFDIPGVKAVRVAMTHKQADEYHVSQSVDEVIAKGKKKKRGLKIKESTVKPKFEKRHGRSDCYELEAVPPEVLSGLLDESIRGNIDVETYNAEVVAQAEDVASIRATRTATLQVIRTSPEVDGEAGQ